MTYGRGYALRLTRNTIWIAYGTAVASPRTMNTNIAEAEKHFAPYMQGKTVWALW